MAENSLYQLFRYYYSKLKTFFKTRNVLSFLLFLALSTAFWFTNALDKIRETEILIPLKFSGLPKNIMISGEVPKYVVVTVKDQGLNLFSYSNTDSSPITLELNQNSIEKGEINIGKDQLKGRISRYLLPTTTIVGFKPDFISLRYEKLHSVKKQIKLLAAINTAPQYILSDDIRFKPSEVTVYGPKSILDTLQFIYTEKLILNDLKDTLSTNCRLSQIKNLKFSSDEVKVNIFTEMFTEKQTFLPVTVINCPENIKITCFPAQIEAVFNIGMSHFSTMNNGDLQLILDYNQIMRDSDKKQKLMIKNNTKYITNIRISQDEVEYIIE